MRKIRVGYKIETNGRVTLPRKFMNMIGISNNTVVTIEVMPDEARPKIVIMATTPDDLPNNTRFPSRNQSP